MLDGNQYNNVILVKSIDYLDDSSKELIYKEAHEKFVRAVDYGERALAVKFDNYRDWIKNNTSPRIINYEELVSYLAIYDNLKETNAFWKNIRIVPTGKD